VEQCRTYLKGFLEDFGPPRVERLSLKVNAAIRHARRAGSAAPSATPPTHRTDVVVLITW
jgi:hypothetical protein